MPEAEPKAKRLRQALPIALKRWWTQGHSDSAAALAFYSIFSLVPMLVLVMQVSSFVIDVQLAEAELRQRLAFLAGDEVAKYVAGLIQNSSKPLTFSLSSAFSLLLIFITSSRVVAKLRETLNEIFGTTKKARKRAIVLSTLLGRLLSVGLVGSVGIILALSALVSVAFNALLKALHDKFPDVPWESLQLGLVFKSLIAFLLVTALLTLTLRWLPRNPPTLKPAVIGAAVSSIGFMTLERVISLYFKFASFSGVFSGALALILLLFWIFVAMQIVLFGAELARALKTRSPRHSVKSA